MSIEPSYLMKWKLDNHAFTLKYTDLRMAKKFISKYDLYKIIQYY